MGPAKESSVVVELSLEHDLFPAAELEALRHIADFIPERIDREFALLRCRDAMFTAQKLCSRLAFSHSVSHLLGEYPSWNELLESTHPYRKELNGKTFRVRVVTREREMKQLVPSMERELGSVIGRNGKVDIDNADLEFRVFAGRGHFLLTVLHCPVDRRAIDRRSVSNRIFFSPVSLPPRYARGLLNLCAASEGDRILDPFCGTGGIIMEAILMGADAAGTDIDGTMVEGTAANLRQIGMGGKCDLRVLDVSDIPSLGLFDVIATDPPYGRSSYMNREKPKALYARAMKAFALCLRSGGRLGIVLPDPSIVEGAEDFTLEMCIAQKVHRSLTRHFMLFTRD